MQQLEVGTYLHHEPRVYPEGAFFEIFDDTMVFSIFLSSPTPDERHSFSKGAIEVGTVTVEGLQFLLLKLGNLEWIDCPYNIHLESHRPDLSRPNPGEGYGVLLMLVDASDGKIQALRLISLSNRFSHQLVEAVEQQEVVPHYDTKLRSVYARYSTTDFLPLAQFNSGKTY